jgi:hypothetical protein
MPDLIPFVAGLAPPIATKFVQCKSRMQARKRAGKIKAAQRFRTPVWGVRKRLPDS